MALLGFLGLSLLVLLAATASASGGLRGWYPAQSAPLAAMPAPWFGWVWAGLYPLGGIAAWLVWRRIEVGVERKRAALRLWGWQLLLGALWPAAFFGLRSPALGLLVLLPLATAAALTWQAFRPLQHAAALMLIPSLLWVCYLVYLDAGFWWLAPVVAI